MKRIAATLSLLCALCLWLGAQNRDAFEEIRLDPHKACTVFNMYDHDIPACAKPPKGYKSVYISHYGRHGARNHSSSSDFALLDGLFREAAEKGILTEAGKQCAESYAAVYATLKGRQGDLCDRGFEQQYRIAGNMYRNHRHLFRGKARIDAVSTIVPRCILTMSAFCDEMLRRNPALGISKQSSEATMYYLNPFSLYNPDVKPTDEGYNNKSAYWQKDFHALRERLLQPEAIFGQFFTDPAFFSGYGDPIKLENAFYAIAGSLQCNGQCSDDLLRYIPYDELCRLHECYNFRFYTSKGPDTLYQKGRQWAFSWRTMQDILDKADVDLASGEYAARLRFGHDIIVMSLFALLDVDGYDKPAGSIEEIKDVWRAYDFPMSLNVQFIFYRNCKGDILVRLLYNERDLALPLPDCGTPFFYRYDDFRRFAAERISLARSIIASTQAPPK